MKRQMKSYQATKIFILKRNAVPTPEDVEVSKTYSKTILSNLWIIDLNHFF